MESAQNLVQRDTPPALPISLPMERIAAFCKENRIRKLSLFGSVLREDFNPATSDVDMLVEFEEGVSYGFRFFGIQDDLSDMIGRQVDLNTKEDLSKYFRNEIIATAQPIYKEGEMYEFGQKSRANETYA
jgi:predicted nucleotidyltransferase